jgi:aspartyl aminopeptidase
LHPNYADKHDKNHSPYINKGTVIKVNANQKYASNITGISKFMHVANKAGEPYQQFVTRSDMGCGSTIGPITATRLGIETFDIGLPTYAMHSIRELAGTEDAYSLYKILLGWRD